MCPDCGRAKMLFETEKKAQNFLKYNGDDIPANSDKLRIYYCSACGGYHITSKPYRKKYENNTENLIEAYKRQQKAHIRKFEYSDDIIIQDIQKIAEKAEIMLFDKFIAKKMMKRIITDYFERNKGIPIPRQEKIRHYFNEWFKKC